MLIVKCASVLCARPFQANQFSTKVFEEMEKGIIKCPHCGNREPGDPDTYYLTHPLTEQQEATFRDAGPGSMRAAASNDLRRH